MVPVSRPSTGPEELEALKKVLDSGWLGLGAVTAQFEEAVKAYLGARHVVAVNNGTSALHLGLDALGIGPGDEVIVPSLTYVASIQAILAAGATPVFCESREDDLLMDLNDLKQRITPRTKALMPVHYCGNPCDMDALLTLAKQYGFWVIEDAAHAFGSTYKGRKIGSFGHATCFSFDPIKTITCGEGGAVAVHDDSLAEKLRCKRILGIDKDAWRRYQDSRNWFYEVTTQGFRYHMPNFCAAIGLTQIKKIGEFIRKRREICLRYDKAFADLKAVRTLNVNYKESAPHIYVVRVRKERRDQFMDFLKERGVASGVHYIANHIQPAFKRFVGEPLPVASRLWKEIVTLPLYYDMTNSDVEKVIESVLSFSSRHCEPAEGGRSNLSSEIASSPPRIGGSSQ